MKFLYIFFISHKTSSKCKVHWRSSRPPSQKNKFALFFCNVCVAQIRMWVKNRLILPVTVKERASRLRQTDIFPMNTGVWVVTHCRRWMSQHHGIPLLLEKGINSWFPFFYFLLLISHCMLSLGEFIFLTTSAFQEVKFKILYCNPNVISGNWL